MRFGRLHVEGRVGVVCLVPRNVGQRLGFLACALNLEALGFARLFIDGAPHAPHLFQAVGFVLVILRFGMVSRFLISSLGCPKKIRKAQPHRVMNRPRRSFLGCGFGCVFGCNRPDLEREK